MMYLSCASFFSFVFFFLMIRRPPRSTLSSSSAASDVYKRQVYVSCDPATLARDVAYLAERGYPLTGLRAFDLYPMTHHVECVACLLYTSDAADEEDSVDLGG